VNSSSPNRSRVDMSTHAFQVPRDARTCRSKQLTYQVSGGPRTDGSVRAHLSDPNPGPIKAQDSGFRDSSKCQISSSFLSLPAFCLPTSSMAAAIDGFVDDPRFSRTVELAPDAANGRNDPFRVKYADYGYRNEAHPEQEQILLFFGPLMGSRLLHVAKDDLAKKHRIRIIHPDRPGVGGTDAVDVNNRMRVWRGKLSLGLIRIPH
jgi:hypothetical protein